MKYIKPYFKSEKFTINDSVLAEYISAAGDTPGGGGTTPPGSDDENSPVPGFEVIGDALGDILNID